MVTFAGKLNHVCSLLKPQKANLDCFILKKNRAELKKTKLLDYTFRSPQVLQKKAQKVYISYNLLEFYLSH